ncbi:hypothetical protein F5887DRAFT_951536 [Amanita rubescens]|nr:hypothetical protein F5887DRAFT_951536 [Amanita rubescens]
MLARARHHVLRRPLVSSLHSETINRPPPKLSERKVKLPKKPPVPTGPNVYVTNKEYLKYIRPLFWYRWTIKFFARDLFLKDGELYAGAFNCPYLKRDMHFFGVENAKLFLGRLTRICRAAGKEPFLSIRKVTYGPEYDAYRITVLSCTPKCHDAPSLLDADATRIGPGISIYDARFAVVLEKAFFRFLWTKRAFDSPWRHLVIPKNVANIKAKQREEDLALSRKELVRHSFVQTPTLEDVIPQPVPEPLPCVSNEPCTDVDFGETIESLFSRGWYVVYNNVTVNVNGEFQVQKQPVLNGFFRFTSFPATMQFSRDVLELADAEKIAVSLWSDAQTVTVQGVSEVNGNMVMTRDARFATLVEQLFVDQYSRHARRSQVRAMKFLAQPRTVEELLTHPGARSHRTYMWDKWEKIVHKRQLVENREREVARSVTVTAE